MKKKKVTKQDILFLCDMLEKIYDYFERSSMNFYSEKEDLKIKSKIKRIKENLCE